MRPPGHRPSPLLCQLSGVPGAGKSTVAQHLVRTLEAVAIDHDTVKSALVDSGLSQRSEDPWNDPENLAEPTGAGHAAYACAMALAADLLNYGLPVVHDSPCYYRSILDLGLAVAASASVPYLLIECRTDLAVVEARLRARTPRPTQCRGLSSVDGQTPDAQLFKHWESGMVSPPPGVPFLTLDTERADWRRRLEDWLISSLS